MVEEDPTQEGKPYGPYFVVFRYWNKSSKHDVTLPLTPSDALFFVVEI